MGRYKKDEDPDVLSWINKIIEKRPTYGYKRVTAMINKDRKKLDLDNYNKKRILRVMNINGLMLPKSCNIRDHIPTGKIEVLHSNTRWCSDCFEIKCFNGEKIYVGFSLDCKDREAISFVASKEPILATDIQMLMINSVDSRFQSDKTPRQIEWLSDRGSVYRAIDTKYMAAQLGLKPCYTAPSSPQSNGMAESFVKTIKRDYVYVSDCYSADITLSLLAGWFEDYNNVAPHSALEMMSPIEYRNRINFGV